MKKNSVIFFFIFILNLFAIKVNSQYSFSDSFTSNISIESVFVFTLTNNTSNNVSFTTVNQLTNGITVSNHSTFAIKSNEPWILSAKSATTYFSASGTYSSNNMPASILSLVVPGKTAIALSTANQTLNSGNRGNASASGNTFSTNLTASPGFNYGPGNYSISINYTLSAQ